MHQSCKKVYLSRACLDEEEKAALCDVLDGGYLGMGEYVRLFEQELAAYLHSPVACVCNGTAALHLALQACGVGPGDEVIIPSITYLATFQAASATGATPVACDVDPVTCCTLLESVQQNLTPQTKAIVHVHYGSGVGEREALFDFAKAHKLRVIEDAAHSFGGTHRGRRIGCDGDVLCFSFDGIKNITAAEGGAVVSHDRDLIGKVSDLRLLAVPQDTQQRYTKKRTWEFDIHEQGWRYHMSNMNAALGRVQLNKVHSFVRQRQERAQQYCDALADLPLRHLPLDYSQVAPHIFPIWVDASLRTPLMDHLLDEYGVETGIHYQPNHLLSKYRLPHCPHAEIWGSGTLSLPMHARLTHDDVALITNGIRRFFEQNSSTSSRGRLVI